MACDGARSSENAGTDYGSDADRNTEAHAKYAQQMSGSAAGVTGFGGNTNSS